MNQFKTIAFKDGSTSLDVRVSVEDGTIWLSAKEMAKLFGYDASTIRRHIKTTYNELTDQSCSWCAQVAHTLCKDGQYHDIPIYNEMIIKEVAERLHSDKFTKLSSTIKNGNVNLGGSNHIIYNNGSLSLDVTISPKEETVWLTQAQIATLFDTTQQNVSLHIKNIIEEGELLDSSVHKDYLYTASDGKQYLTSVYNLDLILAVGYRTKGQRAIEFRKWVSNVLRQYLINGYAINENRINSYSDIILNIEKETLELRNQLDSLKKKFDFGIARARIFFSGQIFDAYEYICTIVRQATKNIRIIDPFVNDRALAILSKSQSVDRFIYTTNPGPISKKDLGAFRAQYGNLEIKHIKKFHDRFIIIDDIECYSLGTSINGAGLKTFAVIKLEDKNIIQNIIDIVNK